MRIITINKRIAQSRCCIDFNTTTLPITMHLLFIKCVSATHLAKKGVNDYYWLTMLCKQQCTSETFSYPTFRWSTRASVRQVAAEMASRLRLSGQVKHIKIKLYVKATETLNNPVSFVYSFC